MRIHRSPDPAVVWHYIILYVASCTERDRGSMFGQAEQSLGVVFTHTEKDELKKSHTAASMKKREKEKKKKHRAGEDPKPTGYDQ